MSQHDSDAPSIGPIFGSPSARRKTPPQIVFVVNVRPMITQIRERLSVAGMSDDAAPESTRLAALIDECIQETKLAVLRVLLYFYLHVDSRFVWSFQLFDIDAISLISQTGPTRQELDFSQSALAGFSSVLADELLDKITKTLDSASRPSSAPFKVPLTGPSRPPPTQLRSIGILLQKVLADFRWTWASSHRSLLFSPNKIHSDMRRSERHIPVKIRNFVFLLSPLPHSPMDLSEFVLGPNHEHTGLLNLSSLMIETTLDELVEQSQETILRFTEKYLENRIALSWIDCAPRVVSEYTEYILASLSSTMRFFGGSVIGWETVLDPCRTAPFGTVFSQYRPKLVDGSACVKVKRAKPKESLWLRWSNFSSADFRFHVGHGLLMNESNEPVCKISLHDLSRSRTGLEEQKSLFSMAVHSSSPECFQLRILQRISLPDWPVNHSLFQNEVLVGYPPAGNSAEHSESKSSVRHYFQALGRMISERSALVVSLPPLSALAVSSSPDRRQGIEHTDSAHHYALVFPSSAGSVFVMSFLDSFSHIIAQGHVERLLAGPAGDAPQRSNLLSQLGLWYEQPTIRTSGRARTSGFDALALFCQRFIENHDSLEGSSWEREINDMTLGVWQGHQAHLLETITEQASVPARPLTDAALEVASSTAEAPASRSIESLWFELNEAMLDFVYHKSDLTRFVFGPLEAFLSELKHAESEEETHRYLAKIMSSTLMSSPQIDQKFRVLAANVLSAENAPQSSEADSQDTSDVATVSPLQQWQFNDGSDSERKAHLSAVTSLRTQLEQGERAPRASADVLQRAIKSRIYQVYLILLMECLIRQQSSTPFDASIAALLSEPPKPKKKKKNKGSKHGTGSGALDIQPSSEALRLLLVTQWMNSLNILLCATGESSEMDVFTRLMYRRYYGVLPTYILAILEISGHDHLIRDGAMDEDFDFGSLDSAVTVGSSSSSSPTGASPTGSQGSVSDRSLSQLAKRKRGESPALAADASAASVFAPGPTVAVIQLQPGQRRPAPIRRCADIRRRTSGLFVGARSADSSDSLASDDLGAPAPRPESDKIKKFLSGSTEAAVRLAASDHLARVLAEEKAISKQSMTKPTTLPQFRALKMVVAKSKQPKDPKHTLGPSTTPQYARSSSANAASVPRMPSALRASRSASPAVPVMTALRRLPRPEIGRPAPSAAVVSPPRSANARRPIFIPQTPEKRRTS
ncbi:uncharacterized protein BJ171DRAFT_487872 [Polychytrium aggregatum]|uniref:uncharacterized protein n=1 Tax=Polychytrium aggregatum TaxID=110093 RepID=UPI0022FE0A87|nr:uncharacterized protein BJ171DRAFT_487872 [Polychytrium aggregatum]KAI9208935.1 hypothetical protein BJ171DRAFT_487872 [Polychytrium aggregatum]